MSPGEVIPKAIVAAKRALQLDSQLAEAHFSLGFGLLCRDCDWSGAEREFRRAIELNPGTVPARYWLGWLHSCAGNHAAAIEHCQQAAELDPFSPIARTFFGWMYYHAGKLREAEQQLRKVIELDGRFVFGCAAALRMCDGTSKSPSHLGLAATDSFRRDHPALTCATSLSLARKLTQ